MCGLVDVENALILGRPHGFDGEQLLHRISADFSAPENILQIQ